MVSVRPSPRVLASAASEAYPPRVTSTVSSTSEPFRILGGRGSLENCSRFERLGWAGKELSLQPTAILRNGLARGLVSVRRRDRIPRRFRAQRARQGVGLPLYIQMMARAWPELRRIVLWSDLAPFCT
jgi:hypothetical protein